MYGELEGMNYSPEAVAAPEMIDTSAIDGVIADIEAKLDADSIG